MTPPGPAGSDWLVGDSETVERQPYELVFMDIHMPGVDGLAATRMIRERWSGPTGPRIVGLSGDVPEHMRDSCMTAGMDDYMAKPATVEDYADALARAGEASLGLRTFSQPLRSWTEPPGAPG